MFVSVLERQKAILKRQVFITQLSGKDTVESLLFELVGPAHFYAGGNAVT